MAWCLMLSNHCLSQWWHRSMLQYGISWPQWVNVLALGKRGHVYKVLHCNAVIMSVMASQITSLTIVYSSVYAGANQRKHESSTSLAFVRGIHWWPVNSPHKGLVTQKMFPFDDVIMGQLRGCSGASAKALATILTRYILNKISWLGSQYLLW